MIKRADSFLAKYVPAESPERLDSVTITSFSPRNQARESRLYAVLTSTGSAGAGALVGGSFGYLRQGGVRGTGLGLLLGMGLGGGLKGLEVAVDTLVKRVEAAERANGRPA